MVGVVVNFMGTVRFQEQTVTTPLKIIDIIYNRNLDHNEIILYQYYNNLKYKQFHQCPYKYVTKNVILCNKLYCH